MRNVLHKLLGATIAAWCLVATDAAAAGHASIGFVASQSGTELKGSFERFAANIQFDPAQPDKGNVQVRVETASVSTGTRSADEQLRGEDFFDATRFPQANFEAREFHAQDAGHYLAKGSFTLKGHTVPLPVTFAVTRDGQGLWFDGTFTISRLNFGVGQGEWSDTSTLDDAVQVRFHLFQGR